MRKGTAKSSRGTWSENENLLLIRLVDKKDKKCWNDIAKAINEKYGKNKTGKQCRERFRNYANPKLNKDNLKQDEKLLFIILHKIHGNHWSEIAKYLNYRSDITIKNYFYRVVRKATKHLNTRDIPPSFLKSPEKFYRLFSVLSYIREHYLPNVKNLPKLPKYTHKERMILNLLSTRKVTEEAMNSYEEHMINAFRHKFGSNGLPIKINLSLEQFKHGNKKAKKLKDSVHLYNTTPLSKLIVIQLIDNKEEIKSLPSVLVHASKSTKDSEPTEKVMTCSPYYANVYNYPPLYGHIPIIQPVLHPIVYPLSPTIFPQTNFTQPYLFPQLVQPVYRPALGGDEVRREESVREMEVRSKEDRRRKKVGRKMDKDSGIIKPML
jgi:hypothetical protein